jgi:hypothetical protein
LGGTRSADVAADAHARRVDHRKVNLLLGARVLLRVGLAEEPVAFVDAERTNDNSRA